MFKSIKIVIIVGALSISCSAFDLCAMGKIKEMFGKRDKAETPKPDIGSFKSRTDATLREMEGRGGADRDTAREIRALRAGGVETPLRKIEQTSSTRKESKTDETSLEMQKRGDAAQERRKNFARDKTPSEKIEQKPTEEKAKSDWMSVEKPKTVKKSDLTIGESRETDKSSTNKENKPLEKGDGSKALAFRQSEDTATPKPAGGAYGRLGVSQDATDAEINKAFKKIALKYHPDKQGNKSPAEQAIAKIEYEKITKARDQLLDPEKRKAVDAKLLAGKQPQPLIAGSEEKKLIEGSAAKPLDSISGALVPYKEKLSDSGTVVASESAEKKGMSKGKKAAIGAGLAGAGLIGAGTIGAGAIGAAALASEQSPSDQSGTAATEDKQAPKETEFEAVSLPE